ncbi:hypothetical protein ACFL5O_11300 [Myxococcota bacterium]
MSCAHDGISPSYPELPHQPHRLDGLVQAVLLDQVRRAKTGDAG